MSQTRDQHLFTISEVAAYWHEPIVPQRIMWPSIARVRSSCLLVQLIACKQQERIHVLAAGFEPAILTLAPPPWKI